MRVARHSLTGTYLSLKLSHIRAKYTRVTWIDNSSPAPFGDLKESEQDSRGMNESTTVPLGIKCAGDRSLGMMLCVSLYL